MAKSATPKRKSVKATAAKAASAKKSGPRHVTYLLAKGTPRLLNARVNREEIHLLVNGPQMLYSFARLLTSLDMTDGATFQAWQKLSSALKCTSYCGQNGTTEIPLEVEASRIGTCLLFSLGPMAMYQSQVVIRPKKKGRTMREVLDETFGYSKSYSAMLVPEVAVGHAEHDASIFEPPPSAGGHGHDHH